MAWRCLSGEYKKIRKKRHLNPNDEAIVANKTPTKTTRYIDEFITLDCAPMLLSLKIFPNAKEISEAMSTFHAFRRFIQPHVPKVQQHQSKCIICVGDGATPRCAALFALRCKGWEVVAIDPLMRITASSEKAHPKNYRMKKKLQREQQQSTAPTATTAITITTNDASCCWENIHHLSPVRAKVEDVLVTCDVAIVILMHCHVDLSVALSCVDAKHGVLGLLTCPCCEFISRHTICFDRPPDVNYLDYGILSEKREMRLWVNDLSPFINTATTTDTDTATTTTAADDDADDDDDDTDTDTDTTTNRKCFNYAPVQNIRDILSLPEFTECARPPPFNQQSIIRCKKSTPLPCLRFNFEDVPSLPIPEHDQISAATLTNVIEIRSTIQHVKTRKNIVSIAVGKSQNMLMDVVSTTCIANDDDSCMHTVNSKLIVNGDAIDFINIRVVPRQRDVRD
jgi:hypothetical protein